MNSLNSSHLASTLSQVSYSELESVHRLVVLVPDMEWDYIPAMRRIQKLANIQRAHIQFLGLCNDNRREFSLRRTLATMCAIVQDGSVPVEAKVEIGTNWVDVVKRNCQTSDMIVCFAEQRAGTLNKPLSQILQSNLKIPVYVLAGFFSQKPKLTWLSHVIAWSGFIGIILGFCLLQVRIIQLPTDWFQNVALILSIIPEYWLILVWNNQFG